MIRAGFMFGVVLIMACLLSVSVRMTVQADNVYGFPRNIMKKSLVLAGEKGSVKVTSFKSSNKSILELKKASKPKYYDVEYYLVTKNKNGKVTISYKYEMGGEKITVKNTYYVYKYSNPFKSIRVGSKNLTSKFNKSTVLSGLKKGLSGKLKISLKSGWKLGNIYKRDGVKVSNNGKITLGKDDYVLIELKNKKHKFTQLVSFDSFQ